MLKFVIGDEGRLAPQWVILYTVEGEQLCEGEFLIQPSRDSDRRRRQKDLRLCPKCGGLGWLALGANAPKCPYCHGRGEQPSFDKPEVLTAVAAELCLDWRGVKNRGEDWPFTLENLTRMVTEHGVVCWAMSRASDALGEGQALTSGKV